MSKYYIDAEGRHLGAFEGSVPAGGIEVAFPASASDTWDGAEWVAAAVPEAETRYAAMLAGVLFEGTMCSAMKEDQWGLNSIKSFVLSGADVPFEFMNGNTLKLTSSNIAAFEAVWIPFRFGFF